MIDVLIVDDQPLVRAGISMLLMAEDDIRVIGEAGSGQQALQLARSSCPDVVLMDVRMPGMDGVAATRELVRESKGNPDRLVRVLIMTTFDDEDVVVQALQAGASGYLLKHASPTEIADAIRRVAAGDTWLDATAATRLVQRLRASSAVPTDITEMLQSVMHDSGGDDSDQKRLGMQENMERQLTTFYDLVKADPGRTQATISLGIYAHNHPELQSFGKRMYQKQVEIASVALQSAAERSGVHWLAPVETLGPIVIAGTNSITLIYLSTADDEVIRTVITAVVRSLMTYVAED